MLFYSMLRKAVKAACNAVTVKQLSILTLCTLVVKLLLIRMEHRLDFRVDILPVNDIILGIAERHILTINTPVRA